jgi:hypothetical protein
MRPAAITTSNFDGQQSYVAHFSWLEALWQNEHGKFALHKMNPHRIAVDLPCSWVRRTLSG